MKKEAWKEGELLTKVSDLIGPFMLAAPLTVL